VKLEFLGTRGYIEARTERHARHSTLKVTYNGRAVAIDCGEDWLGQLGDWHAQAIVVTHAHPDHAWGLQEGAPCPVYATADAWETMADYDIRDRQVLAHRQPAQIEGMAFEAFPVDHSTQAPAVGYRITAGAVTVFYVPDVVWIRDREAALSGVNLYIGDGATIQQSFVRKSEGTLIGHTPVRTQLTWCQKEGVPRAIFTHCGPEIVEGDEQTLAARIQSLAEARGVEAGIAYDGLQLVLR
jgi:phosphoribosyl 1,2-cyclic phosphodiesterase